MTTSLPVFSLRPLGVYDCTEQAPRRQYDVPSQQVIRLMRKLCCIRRGRKHIHCGPNYFFNDWEYYRSMGLLLFARHQDATTPWLR